MLQACGISVLWPRIEPGPLQWKPRILTTRLPGHSLSITLTCTGKKICVWLALLQYLLYCNGLPWWLSGKEPACQCWEMWVQLLGWEDPLEKAMATHSSTLAWKIPWMEELGGLQSMGLLRVGHDWVTSLSFFTFMHWRRKWQPTPVFLPGESQGWESLVGFRLWGRTESDMTAALSSSSSSSSSRN